MLEVKVSISAHQTLEVKRNHQTVFIYDDGKLLIQTNEHGLTILIDALMYINHSRFY